MKTSHIDDTKFNVLLERWNHHQQLRTAGAPIPTLAASRTLLDSARSSLRQAA